MADLSARRNLRNRIRRARRALPAHVQRLHARTVARRVLTSRLPLFARRIALYAPSDGELDPSPLIDALIARHRMVALPVVLPDRLLGFYRYTPATKLIANRYGLAEPDPNTSAFIDRRTLSAVLVPLVAFDANGHRLGMGGGYFDTTFADPHQRPLLIGLAHSLQQVEAVPRQPWDVPLDGVATESGLLICSVRGAAVLQLGEI